MVWSSEDPSRMEGLLAIGAGPKQLGHLEPSRETCVQGIQLGNDIG